MLRTALLSPLHWLERKLKKKKHDNDGIKLALFMAAHFCPAKQWALNQWSDFLRRNRSRENKKRNKNKAIERMSALCLHRSSNVSFDGAFEMLMNFELFSSAEMRGAGQTEKEKMISLQSNNYQRRVSRPEWHYVRHLLRVRFGRTWRSWITADIFNWNRLIFSSSVDENIEMFRGKFNLNDGMDAYE